MKNDELAAFLKGQVEPLPDTLFGPRYRAAARLSDGTFLPCVVFQSRRKIIDLASRRLDETRTRSSQEHLAVVDSFVAGASRLAEWDVRSVEASPFAWSVDLLRTIEGETTMGWTSFVAEMHDGARFSMGTTFRFEFFDLPDGYRWQDIRTIHSGMVHGETTGLQRFSMERLQSVKVYREKPFFTCYIDGLDT